VIAGMLLGVTASSRGATSPPGTAAAPLLEIPVPESPVVVIRVLVNAGSMDDPAGKEGLCKLAMEAAADGGTGALTRSQLVDLIYPMDASVDVFVDRETSVFTGRVRREDLAEFFPIFWDRVFRPRFAVEDFARAKERALSSLQNDLCGSDDERLGKEGLQAIIFEGTAYAHPPIGTVAGVKSIEVAEVREFHHRMMTRERLEIGIAGGYDGSFGERLRKEINGLPEGAGAPSGAEAESADRGRPAGREARPVITPPPIHGLEVLLIDKPARSTAISLGFPHDVTRRDPDYWPLYVALTAWGEHRTFLGRLQREMRGQRGLNYGNYAYLDHFEQDSWSRFARPTIWRSAPHLSIWIRPVQPANGLFALRMAIWELRTLIANGLTQSEFETTREHLRNVSQLWRQTLARRLGLAMEDAHFSEPDGLASLRRALDTMTLEQVNRALARRLTGTNLKAVLVCAHADSLRSLLDTGAPTPIVYSGGDAPSSVKDLDEVIAGLPWGVGSVRVATAQEMFR
jgi:zinc protease